MELCPFRDCFRFWGRLEFFHLGGQGKHLGLKTCLVCFPSASSRTFPHLFLVAPLMGPAQTVPLVCKFLQLEAEQEGNSRVAPPGKGEQHCDMSDKPRLLPAVPTAGNNSPAAVRKAFSWGGLGAPSRTIPWLSPHPAQLLPGRAPGAPWEAPPYLGNSTSHGATQTL